MTTPPPDPAARTAARTVAARTVAARAHQTALLNVVPLLGVFAAVGLFRSQGSQSDWAARQALQAALFQFLSFNLALIVVTCVAVAAAFAWESSYRDGALALAVVLTALPVYLAYYGVQAVLAWRAAGAVRRGDDYRYPMIGRLMGPRP